MSKLDELIREYCPDGVENRLFNEIAKYVRGVTYGKSYEITDGSDGYNLLRANNITLSSNTLNFDDVKTISFSVKVKPEQMLHEGDVLICAGSGSKEHIGKVAYLFESIDYTFGGFMGVVRANSKIILPRYIFHFLTSQMFKEHLYKVSGASSSTINNINNDTWKNLEIPVPSLPVQEEIVRILDSFTQLTAELQAELQARKRQYEYYRNAVLTNIDAEEFELGDVCKFIRGPFGGSLKKECFQPSGYAVYEQQHAIYENLDFRYFISQEKFNELKRFKVIPGELIVSCSGTIGRVFIIPDNAPDGIINQALLKLTPSERVNATYLKYFFENTITAKLNNSARGGAIKNVPSVGELKAIKINLPSIEQQIQIVNLLDIFSKICNDMQNGLPAEIEARQKQYEYYRDKLLTFQELS